MRTDLHGSAHRSHLRILTVANVTRDPNSGAAGTVFHTSLALREKGHEVDEIWADRLGPRRITHGNLHSLLEQPRAYRREVLKAVASKSYDVVMISQPQGYLAARALKKIGYPGVTINRSHGLELRADVALAEWYQRLGVPESRYPWFTALIKPLLARQWDQAVRWFDGIIVPCEMDREYLIERYKGRALNVKVIHHGVSDDLVQNAPPPMTMNRLNRVLHVGQFAFFKGPHLVAQIMNRVLDAHPDLEFTWVSSVDGCQQAKAIIDRRFDSRVRFLNWTTQERLARIYDEHGIFLFPTLCEGAAKSALEAMSRGLCVVGSDDSGIRDYAERGVNAVVCPVGEVDMFRDQVLRLSQDMSRATRISSSAAEYASGKTWTACASQIETFSCSLLDHVASSRGTKSGWPNV